MLFCLSAMFFPEEISGYLHVAHVVEMLPYWTPDTALFFHIGISIT